MLEVDVVSRAGRSRDRTIFKLWQHVETYTIAIKLKILVLAQTFFNFSKQHILQQLEHSNRHTKLTNVNNKHNAIATT